MSYVTSVTIATDLPSDELHAAIVAEFDFGHGPTEFRELDRHAAGGTKLMSHRVYAAGLNYADREMLRAWADGLPWGTYGSGVVLVDTEGDYVEVWRYGKARATTTRSENADAP